jgi:hypothetical protein
MGLKSLFQSKRYMLVNASLQQTLISKQELHLPCHSPCYVNVITPGVPSTDTGTDKGALN